MARDEDSLAAALGDDVDDVHDVITSRKKSKSVEEATNENRRPASKGEAENSDPGRAFACTSS